MQLQHPHYQRITINPAVCFGKPCIRGFRFPVTTLLGYLATGMPVDELLKEFPFLEQADVLEALSFSARAMDEKYLPLKQARA